MLTHRERLAGSMIGADLHTAARACDLRVSRFSLVIDDQGHECGAVSNRYRLIQNADMVSALDLATDKLGIDLEAESGKYRNGRSEYGFFTGDEFTVPGDKSKLRNRIVIGNGYGGAAKITGISGTYRLLCSNGMSVGDIYTQMEQRHTGEFNLLVWMEALLMEALEHCTHEQARAVIQASTEFQWSASGATSEDDQVERERNNSLLTVIGQDTPKRYRTALGDSIINYRQTVGQTVWAMTQAIAEIATHDMHDTQTAGAWARRNQQRVLEAVGI